MMQYQKRPICTIGLIMINVVVFFWLSFGGRTEDALYMLEHGAMYTPIVLEERQYRMMFTSLFLHFGFSHLMNNMITLYVMGWNLEHYVGRVRFCLIYILSGLGGNVLSMLGELLTRDYHVSAGASGAIFGLTGALLCLALFTRGRVGTISRQGLIFIVVLNLYNGFTSSGVDNLAHIGGLLTGFLLAFLFYWKMYAKYRSTSWS